MAAPPRRDLKHSKILYEDENPLLRLSWSKHDSNYLGVFLCSV